MDSCIEGLGGLGGGLKGPLKELGGTETGKASWVGRAGAGKAVDSVPLVCGIVSTALP